MTDDAIFAPHLHDEVHPHRVRAQYDQSDWYRQSAQETNEITLSEWDVAHHGVDLVALAETLSRLDNHAWYVLERDSYSSAWLACNTAEGAIENRLWLAFDRYGHKGRLQIDGMPPQRFDNDLGLKHHEITVDPRRGAFAVAKEIVRRVLPVYREDLADAQARKNAADTAEQMYMETANLLVDLIEAQGGWTVYRARQGERGWHEASARHQRIKLDNRYEVGVEFDGYTMQPVTRDEAFRTHVNLKLTQLSPDVAQDVLRHALERIAQEA